MIESEIEVNNRQTVSISNSRDCLISQRDMLQSRINCIGTTWPSRDRR